MLTKDQAFSVNEFINRYSNESISGVSEELIALISDYSKNSNGYLEINRFIFKYGDKYVWQVNDKVFELAQKLTEKLSQELEFKI